MRIKNNIALLALFAVLLQMSQLPVVAAGESAPAWKILNLDIDQSVSAQKKLSPFIDERKDLHNSVNAIRLWTNSKGLKILRAAVSDLRAKYPEDKWLTFVGSGDFHQVTATLIESLPKSAQPLTIILFDNHPDWFKAPAHYHCGAWVVQALKHSFVEQVIMLAQNSADLRGDQFRLAPYNELCKGRVEMHPLLRKSSFVPLVWNSRVAGVESAKVGLFGTELRFQNLRDFGVQNLAEKLSKNLAGKNVYISIDKDVLDLNDAVTDWDQGQLSLKEMLEIISRVSENARIVGVDVCGERAPEPVHGLLKSFDCGRQFKRKIKNFDLANLVNERTNLEIIKTLRQAQMIRKEVSGSIEKN
ncbi:MAG: arginase family protein [Candidatus Obscuribacterales bacterium]|nr:arginase family protein [Candidatus Obscuribacterales bacterium]